MKAAVLVEPERIEIKDVPIPEYGPDDILVQVSHCFICGTDVHIFRGHYSKDKLPLIPGHEFSGTVAQVGARVNNFSLGQKVVADINVGCGTCYFCRRNEVFNCPSIEQLGIHRDGAFAELIAIPAKLAIKIPESLPLPAAALCEPVACVVRSAKKNNIKFAESVLVLGAGPIGNLHVQLLRTIGAAPIIVADIDNNRADLAGKTGADITISDPSKLHETVMGATKGRGVDVVIESVGSALLYKEALSLIRPGGRVAAFGLMDAEQNIDISPFDFVLKEVGLKGSVAGMGEDMYQARQLLVYDRIDTTPFLANIRRLDQLQETIMEFAAGNSGFKYLVQMGAG